MQTLLIVADGGKLEIVLWVDQQIEMDLFLKRGELPHIPDN